MGDEAGPAVAVGGGQDLHQLPAGIVGSTRVADLAGRDEALERGQELLDRSRGVECVELQQVDMVRTETTQRAFDRADQTAARHAAVARAVAGRQAGLGRDQDGVAPSLDRLAQHLFGSPVRIDVGGIEQIDAGLQADVDQPAGLDRIARPQAPNSGPLPPKVPVPRLRTGTRSPDDPS